MSDLSNAIETSAPPALASELATLVVQLNAHMRRGGFALLMPIQLEGGQSLPAEVLANIVLSDVDDCVAMAMEQHEPSTQRRWTGLLDQLRMLKAAIGDSSGAAVGASSTHHPQ